MVNLAVGLVVLRRKGDGDTGPGQTRKKPKDLSARDREERGRGEGVVCMLCVGHSEERQRGVGLLPGCKKKKWTNFFNKQL